MGSDQGKPLKTIYQEATVEQAEMNLVEFESALHRPDTYRRRLALR
ncbi:MAG: hypothetical protein AB7F20_10285 [Geoalkalibacter sp.]